MLDLLLLSPLRDHIFGWSGFADEQIVKRGGDGRVALGDSGTLGDLPLLELPESPVCWLTGPNPAMGIARGNNLL